jgi:hypothetical protein
MRQLFPINKTLLCVFLKVFSVMLTSSSDHVIWLLTAILLARPQGQGVLLRSMPAC